MPATLGVAGIAAFCCLGGVFAIGGEVGRRAKGLTADLERARESGLSTDLSQLKREVSAGQDARPLLEEAFRRLKLVPVRERREIRELATSLNGSRESEWERATLEAYLDSHRDIVALFERAGKLDGMSVTKPDTWERKGPYEFEDSLRDGALILSARGILIGMKAGPEAALPTLRAGMKIARFSDAQASVVPTLRRAWNEIALHRAAMRLAQEHPKNPGSPKIIREMLAQAGPLPALRRTIGTELPLAFEAMDRNSSRELAYVPAPEIIADAGKVALLDIWKRAFEAMPTEAEDLDGAERALKRLHREASDTEFFYGNYAKGYDNIVPTMRDLLTRRRLNAVGAGLIERWQRGERLDGLPEDLRIPDPHGDEPLRFKREGDGFSLYSVARDGQDDGGKERRFEPGEDKRWDVVFRYAPSKTQPREPQSIIIVPPTR